MKAVALYKSWKNHTIQQSSLEKKQTNSYIKHNELLIQLYR